jgi:hypothetical protein
MNTFRLFCIALLLLTAGSALSQDVRYNFDKAADFSKFKTYKWVTFKNATPVDDLTDKQIKATLDEALALKGLTKVDSYNADLYIGYQVAVGSEQQLTVYSSGWGYGPGWFGGGWYGPSGGITTGQTSTIYTGQLDVDMYDAAKHELVWRGIASKTLYPKAKPEKRQKNLNKVVAKLMKNYPPPSWCTPALPRLDSSLLSLFPRGGTISPTALPGHFDRLRRAYHWVRPASVRSPVFLISNS